MDEGRLWELLAKEKAGEISPGEYIELKQLMEGDENRQAGQIVDLLWNLRLDVEDSEDYIRRNKDVVLNKALNNNIHRGLSRKKVFRIFDYRAIAAAASILIAIVAYYFVWERNKENVSLVQHVISTENMHPLKTILPDGTEVWLNRGSRLIYNESEFGKSNRDIKLEGEAFFDVKRDEKMPFVIHTKTIDLKVLGTAFNLRAYPEEKSTEAVLLHGSIEINLQGRPGNKLYLKPKEKITIRNNDTEDGHESTGPGNKEMITNNLEQPVITFSKIAEITNDSVIAETSWMQNRLVFKAKRFDELANDLGRRYNVKVEFKESGLRSVLFTGSFQDETVVEVFDRLKMTYPFHYSYDSSTRKITIDK